MYGSGSTVAKEREGERKERPRALVLTRAPTGRYMHTDDGYQTHLSMMYDLIPRSRTICTQSIYEACLQRSGVRFVANNPFESSVVVVREGAMWGIAGS